MQKNYAIKTLNMCQNLQTGDEKRFVVMKIFQHRKMYIIYNLSIYS